MRADGSKSTFVYIIPGNSGTNPFPFSGEGRPCSDDEKSDAWNWVLPDGETVLERQLRLLSLQGVRNFVLAAKDETGETADIRVRCLPPGCRVRCVAPNKTVEDMQRTVSETKETASVLLLPGNAIYDYQFAGSLLEAEDGSAVLSKNATNRKNADKFARVDFRYVKELGTEGKGACWFPALSVYKLDAVRILSLASAGDPLTAVEEKIGELDLAPVFGEDGYISRLEHGLQPETVYSEVLARDSIFHWIEKGAACAAQLPDWLETLQTRKPLLVCDPAGLNTPVGDILDYFGISFVKALQPDGPVSANAVRELAAACRDNGCDSVISVGGESAAEAAKLLRICMRYDVEPSETIRPSRAVRWFPHILFSPACTLASDSGERMQAFGGGTFKPYHAIPEITVLDCTITPGSMKPHVKDAGNAPDSFPAGENRLTHAAALYSWYRHRYTVMNQSVVFCANRGRCDESDSRGIFEAMKKMPEYKGFQYTWVVSSPEDGLWLKTDPDTHAVRDGSKEHLYALATSRYIVGNGLLPAAVKLWPEQTYIHIGDGPEKADSRKLSREARKMTALCIPSAGFRPVYSAYYGLEKTGRENILRETGHPRNDRLFNRTRKDKLRIKLLLGIPPATKVVLYAPAEETADSRLLPQELRRELGNGYTVISRMPDGSIRTKSSPDGPEPSWDSVTLQDTMVISDLLVSDDPEMIADYANLQQPVVNCCEERATSACHSPGGAIDPDALPGRTAGNPEELAAAVTEMTGNPQTGEECRQFNRLYNTHDGADCGARIARSLIAPDQLKTKRQQQQEKRLLRCQHGVTRITGVLRTTGLKRSANDRELASFRNKHRGERCFLIGNGPSLRLEDLEALKYEFSFACNKIYKSFDRTDWRPTYYFFTDKVFESELEGIRKAFAGTLFSNNTFNKPQYARYGIVCAHNMKDAEKYKVHGNMLGYYVPSSATVMTYMIEMAMYMGFSEIYLLGVDCSNSFLKTNDHFMRGYMTEEMEKVELRRTTDLATDGRKMTFESLGNYRVSRAMEAYHKLRAYADRHHVRVLNATRGGNLEAFERVDIDRMVFREKDGGLPRQGKP